MRPRVLAALPAAACLLAAALSSCAAPGAATSPRGTITVVAGEDNWGSLARMLGAGVVTVHSIITSPSADPHSYTASAADAATVDSASIVIENGAGYDNFLAQLVAASGRSPRVLDVARIVGASGPDPNPHFWYSPAFVERVAAAITGELSALAPSHRARFAAALRALRRAQAPEYRVLAALRRRFAGVPVAYTERVPGYLLDAAGLVVRTPRGFARAVEQGTQPSFSDQLALRRLLAARGVDVLLDNVQTVSPVTDEAVAEARAAGIPVVAVQETLPPGAAGLVAWQLSVARALLAALSAGR